MAEIVPNEKGFKILRLSTKECKGLGWGIPQGIVCAHCNRIIDGDVYFPAVLNDTLCDKCYDDFITDAQYYREDAKFEESCFAYYCNKLIMNKI
jgi:hypothetical protein